MLHNIPVLCVGIGFICIWVPFNSRESYTQNICVEEGPNQTGATGIVTLSYDFHLSCVLLYFEQVLNGFFENGKTVQPREARPGPRTALGVLLMFRI